MPAAPQVICPACRTPNPVEELFCTSCGGDLSVPAQTPRLGPPQRPAAAARTETAGAAAPARKGGTEVIVRGGGKLVPAAPPAPARAAEAAAPAAKAPAGEAPGSESAESAPKHLGAMRHKLDDMKKGGRSVFIRIPVFLVLAGGAGYGAWYFAPKYFNPHIEKYAQEEKDASFGVWPVGALEDAYEKIKKMSLEDNPARKENPALPFTPRSAPCARRSRRRSRG